MPADLTAEWLGRASTATPTTRSTAPTVVG
jgi:hypothetical protein